MKRDVAAQVKAVGGAVIENFPALRQLGDQPVGIGIDVKQTIVDLSGQRIRPLLTFCGLKVLTWPLTQ